MMSSIARLAGCVTAMTVIGAGFAAAQDCPRGGKSRSDDSHGGDATG